MQMQSRDPDANLVATFRHHPQKNEAKTLAEGRQIFDDLEVVDIRVPGSRDFKTFPALTFARWVTDPITGEQTKQTYAERFSHQYRQWKAQQQQTKSGTPLDHCPFLTEGKRAELRAQNVYTVEQLAAIDGQELKNLGLGGRELKNRASEFIAESKNSAPNLQMAAELEAMRAQNALLAEDLEALKLRQAGEGQFKEMTDDQIRDFITTHTGHAPTGNLTRKTLVRMATDARPSKAA